MVIIGWLIAWLLAGQDPITFSPAVNDWGTALLICACFTLACSVDSE